MGFLKTPWIFFEKNKEMKITLQEDILHGSSLVLLLPYQNLMLTGFANTF